MAIKHDNMLAENSIFATNILHVRKYTFLWRQF